jgi:polyisoprenoid-binding protein YceI
MKSLLKSLLAATFLAAISMPPSAYAAETFVFDPLHTQTIFTISHLGYSTVTGNFHDIRGQVSLDEQRPDDSSVDVTIQTASIDTGVPARDKDLQSAGFFNIQKFPTMTFKSTAVKKTGPTTADVMGDLTLLGVSKSVTLKVTFNREAADQMRNNAVVAGFTASTAIKRSDFGMKAYLPYIGDDVHIVINVEGIKQ